MFFASISTYGWLGFGGAEPAIMDHAIVRLNWAVHCLQRNSVIQNFEEHIWILIEYLCKNIKGVGRIGDFSGQ